MMLFAGVGLFADLKVELAVLKTQISNVQNAAVISSAKIDDANKTIEQVLINVAKQDQQLADIQHNTAK